ncbi:MAG: hypothetical protein ACYC4K_04830 [Thiobacillus sp.]
MFKILSGAAATLALGLTASSMVQAANVDVNINIGQPGYYGRIDIGDFGRPQLIYSEPRVIYRNVTPREPIYLHVPPGHAKNWSKHCAKYNACGERVYFVQDRWYEREYVPRYQARHERDDSREDRHDERHEERRDKHYDKHEDKREKNKGHGKAHGKDH